jgi:hypothetical protein
MEYEQYVSIEWLYDGGWIIKGMEPGSVKGNTIPSSNNGRSRTNQSSLSSMATATAAFGGGSGGGDDDKYGVVVEQKQQQQHLYGQLVVEDEEGGTSENNDEGRGPIVKLVSPETVLRWSDKSNE